MMLSVNFDSWSVKMIRSETNFRFEFVDGVETEPDESEISLCILA